MSIFSDIEKQLSGGSGLTNENKFGNSNTTYVANEEAKTPENNYLNKIEGILGTVSGFLSNRNKESEPVIVEVEKPKRNNTILFVGIGAVALTAIVILIVKKK